MKFCVIGFALMVLGAASVGLTESEPASQPASQPVQSQPFTTKFLAAVPAELRLPAKNEPEHVRISRERNLATWRRENATRRILEIPFDATATLTTVGTEKVEVNPKTTEVVAFARTPFISATDDQGYEYRFYINMLFPARDHGRIDAMQFKTVTITGKVAKCEWVQSDRQRTMYKVQLLAPKVMEAATKPATQPVMAK